MKSFHNICQANGEIQWKYIFTKRSCKTDCQGKNMEIWYCMSLKERLNDSGYNSRHQSIAYRVVPNLWTWLALSCAFLVFWCQPTWPISFRVTSLALWQSCDRQWSNLSWWRHQMKTVAALWPFVRGVHRSPVNSPHKGQWRGALMFANNLANNRDASDLRHQHTHYDVSVMWVTWINKLHESTKIW